MKQVNAWVSDELAAELEQKARDEDRSVSALLRRLIVSYLKEGAKS